MVIPTCTPDTTRLRSLRRCSTTLARGSTSIGYEKSYGIGTASGDALFVSAGHILPVHPHKESESVHCPVPRSFIIRNWHDSAAPTGTRIPFGNPHVESQAQLFLYETGIGSALTTGVGRQLGGGRIILQRAKHRGTRRFATISARFQEFIGGLVSFRVVLHRLLVLSSQNRLFGG